MLYVTFLGNTKQEIGDLGRVVWVVLLIQNGGSNYLQDLKLELINQSQNLRILSFSLKFSLSFATAIYLHFC